MKWTLVGKGWGWIRELAAVSLQETGESCEERSFQGERAASSDVAGMWLCGLPL